MLLCFLSALTSPKIFFPPLATPKVCKIVPAPRGDSPHSELSSLRPQQRHMPGGPIPVVRAGAPSRLSRHFAVPLPAGEHRARRPSGPPPAPQGLPRLNGATCRAWREREAPSSGSLGWFGFFVVVVEIRFPSLPSLLVPLLTNPPSAGPPGVVPRSWKQARPCSPARPDRPALPALPKPNSSSPTHTLYSANKLY